MEMEACLGERDDLPFLLSSDHSSRLQSCTIKSVIHSSARVMMNIEEGVIGMVCRCEMGSLGHLWG